MSNMTKYYIIINGSKIKVLGDFETIADAINEANEEYEDDSWEIFTKEQLKKLAMDIVDMMQD